MAGDCGNTADSVLTAFSKAARSRTAGGLISSLVMGGSMLKSGASSVQRFSSAAFFFAYRSSAFLYALSVASQSCRRISS
jgi:hypothetical protein